MTTLIYHDDAKLRKQEHERLPVAPRDVSSDIRAILAKHGSTLDILSHGVQTSLVSLVHSLRETNDSYLASPFRTVEELDSLRHELKRLRDDAQETVALCETVLADL